MIRPILSLCALMAIAFPALAQEKTPVISSPYAFATAEGQKNGAAFMSIDFGTSGIEQEDHLLSVSSDIADMVELHSMSMEGDVMQMRKIDDAGITIPAGGNLKLQPSGDHIMLMGLHTPLTIGQSIPLTLHFEEAGNLRVDVPVLAPGTMPEAKDSHEPGHSHH